MSSGRPPPAAPRTGRAPGAGPAGRRATTVSRSSHSALPGSARNRRRVSCGKRLVTSSSAPSRSIIRASWKPIFTRPPVSSTRRPARSVRARPARRVVGGAPGTEPVVEGVRPADRRLADVAAARPAVDAPHRAGRDQRRVLAPVGATRSRWRPAPPRRRRASAPAPCAAGAAVAGEGRGDLLGPQPHGVVDGQRPQPADDGGRRRGSSSPITSLHASVPPRVPSPVVPAGFEPTYPSCHEGAPASALPTPGPGPRPDSNRRIRPEKAASLPLLHRARGRSPGTGFEPMCLA